MFASLLMLPFMVLYIAIFVLSICAMITVVRAASCIIRRYENDFGPVRWKWLLFAEKKDDDFLNGFLRK